MAHVACGVACLLAALWVFVDVLNFSAANAARVRKASVLSAIFMWLAFLIGGYWYVFFYPADKSIILTGPWPAAHHFFMETKEHLVILLLMIATYLPIAARNCSLESADARKLTLWIAGLAAVLSLAMEGEGAIIAMGVKVGLLAK